MSEYIFDATPENFNELVIGNSVRGPVLVNYWSANAGPCIKLWPTLESLVKEYDGRFLLINLNSDKYKSFAQNELGVRSVPTLQVFYNQQVVDVMHGAESEQSIRQLLTRHLPRSSDTLLLESVKLYNENKADEAIEELKKLQIQDPENPRIATSIIKLLFRESQFEEMDSFIKKQSAAIKNNEEVISLLTHSKLQIAASKVEDVDKLKEAISADSQNAELRYMSIAVSALQDNAQDALDQLLEMLAIAPAYENNLPMKTMVLLLNTQPIEPALARQYRAKMIDALSVA